MKVRASPAPSPSTGLPIKGMGLFCHEKWNVGIIRQPAADIVARGVTGAVEWFPHPPDWVFLADPSCRIREDGSLDLYAERLDYWRGRGEIWSAHVPAGADPTRASFSPLLKHEAHLSYPFPFTDDDGRSCLTAESWEAGAVLIWYEQDGAWSLGGTLFGGRPVVDPTLWRGDDRWWLFCTFEDDGPGRRLHLFHGPTPRGPWAAHPGNPVVDDQSSARSAGPLFRANGLLIRPSQDNSHTYGGALVLNAVTRLDPDVYREEPIRRLMPVPPYGYGMHTFHPAGDFTLVDGKCWQFHPWELARKVIMPLRRRFVPS